MLYVSCFMILIVGLGNPGKQFEKTRHNVGFRVLDIFQKQRGFSAWKQNKKYRALISERKMGKQKTILAKPQTYMNKSGLAAKSLIENCKPRHRRIGEPTEVSALKTPTPKGRGADRSVGFENLFVVHDDIALPMGKIKISKGRGSAGHKGIESVMKELGSKDFVRFRVGTGPLPPKESLHQFVLETLRPAEEKKMRQVILVAATALNDATVMGISDAMNLYN